MPHILHQLHRYSVVNTNLIVVITAVRMLKLSVIVPFQKSLAFFLKGSNLFLNFRLLQIELFTDEVKLHAFNWLSEASRPIPHLPRHGVDIFNSSTAA